jgi:transcriptional regulator with PAS, ATPase and Fis domain
MAEGGTLLLDEISEMSMESQVYFLRVIEEKVVTRLGGTKKVPLDVRIIAASNRDINREVAEGRFRSDLFYRLNVVRINLPPLRERKEDIPSLVNHFIDTLSSTMLKKNSSIASDALSVLMAYDWPGNLRELRNIIEQSIVNSLGEVITWETLPDQIRNEVPALSHLPEKERKKYFTFLQAYQDTDGNITKVAQQLNVSRPTVYAWRKNLGLT